ncbi:MAG: DUF362 domain-containing protein [Candidatus Electryonea clarkiae]|nr:DUF362 domain-containing protein [Candidatus Electryonea clarkiae]MDP8289125.1 DUF362 domain-containing protein [Candidatus Electryonea clarkiae]
MKRQAYQSMKTMFDLNRRDFVKVTGAAGAGVLLGTPKLWAEGDEKKDESKSPEKPATNIEDALKHPRTEFSLPGKFPGRVIQVSNEAALKDDTPDTEVVNTMFEQGIKELTGADLEKSFHLLFDKDDIVGIKINPVGGKLICTRPEVVESVIAWLVSNGLPRENIIIWDRFDYMMGESGYTAERFPGIGIESLQTLDEKAFEPESTDDSGWLDEHGNHLSLDKFDNDAYYWADVEAPQDKNYLHQHVYNNKYSYFGKLLSNKLTKIINIPVFKNTGNGISMATKNMGYGAICNTGRLHQPLFFDVCVEVLAFPLIRDKMVLNITDGLRGQYDGGPDLNAEYVYDYNTLFFATDPFASDRVCHEILLNKRKEMGVKVNEHPRYTKYFEYAEELGLGIGQLEKIEHIIV